MEYSIEISSWEAFHGDPLKKSAFSDEGYKLVNSPVIGEMPSSPLSSEGDSREAPGLFPIAESNG